MAKGQKKSNREIKKPKQVKEKPVPAAPMGSMAKAMSPKPKAGH